MTLYSLTEEYLQLISMAQDEEMSDVFQDTLEGLEGEIEIKAENIAHVINNLNGDVQRYDEEIKRLSKKKQTTQNSVTRLKKSLENMMRATGKTTLTTPLYSFTIRKSAPALQVLDETKIPKKFFIKKDPVLDRTALKNFIKEKGNTNYAELTQGESLMIK